MSKQAPNKEQTVAECERVIAELERKRQAIAERQAELNATRDRLAYSAHAGLDAAAGRELAVSRTQVLDAEQQLIEIDAALATARQRLQQAQLAHARAEDREQAKALRLALRQFVEAGMAVDRALGALAHNGHALTEALRKVHALGCQFPTQQQLDSLGHICLRSAIMQTPWARSVETVPPGQRRSFRSLIEAWAANVEGNNIKPRLGEQTNSEEAA
jgi:hypothetical protein